MNLSKLTNQILTDGGASYSLHYGDVVQSAQQKKQGFSVSIHKERELILPKQELNEVEIRNFCLENSDLLAEPNNFLGAWIEGNSVYLDVSTFVYSKQKAIKMAKDNNQLAIFDLVNLQTIYV